MIEALKFIYSEKATKFCEIFPLLLTVLQSKVRGRFRKILWPSQIIWTLNRQILGAHIKIVFKIWNFCLQFLSNWAITMANFIFDSVVVHLLTWSCSKTNNEKVYFFGKTFFDHNRKILPCFKRKQEKKSWKCNALKFIYSEKATKFCEIFP